MWIAFLFYNMWNNTPASLLREEFITSNQRQFHRWQGSWGQHGAHLGPTRLGPHEFFYLGRSAFCCYYCHENCVNLVWMLHLGMRGTSVLNIDCYWLNERVCVKCPLVRAVTDLRHLSVSWMMCWLQLDTWAQDAVWCGPLVTELPALKSLKRIPELWIIHTSNNPPFRLIL